MEKEKTFAATIRIIKRWSEAESFTIKVNHVYRHYKNLYLPKFFAFFSPRIDSLTLKVMTTPYFAQI